MPQNGVKLDFNLMICYSAMIGGDEKLKSRQVNDYLLKKIDKVKYQRILTTPKLVNSRVEASSQLDFISDERLAIALDGRSISQQVAESRIMLQVRVPAKIFLECVYIDQPTEIVAPFYKFLLKEGILHLGIESAFEFLNIVDLESWWLKIIESAEFKS